MHLSSSSPPSLKILQSNYFTAAVKFLLLLFFFFLFGATMTMKNGTKKYIFYFIQHLFPFLLPFGPFWPLDPERRFNFNFLTLSTFFFLCDFSASKFWGFFFWFFDRQGLGKIFMIDLGSGKIFMIDFW